MDPIIDTIKKIVYSAIGRQVDYSRLIECKTGIFSPTSPNEIQCIPTNGSGTLNKVKIFSVAGIKYEYIPPGTTCLVGFIDQDSAKPYVHAFEQIDTIKLSSGKLTSTVVNTGGTTTVEIHYLPSSIDIPIPSNPLTMVMQFQIASGITTLTYPISTPISNYQIYGKQIELPLTI